MNWTLAATATAIAMVLGCGATRPPNQLVDARVAYQKASANPAAPMATASLTEAKRALDAAETAYQGGDLTRAKNLAYIAHRRSLAAEARAEMMRAVEMKRVALADFAHFRELQAAAQREQLEREKEALAKVQREADAQKKAREAADDALSKLGGVQIERNDRGLVLTIPGADLFTEPSKKAKKAKARRDDAELLDVGKARLAEIARAVRGDTRSILVVGHTGDAGAREVDQRASEARAEAVRRFLEGEGIESSRLRSEGVVEARATGKRSVAEEAEARRVEIVLVEAQAAKP